MNYALVVIEKPKESEDSRQTSWLGFLGYMEQHMTLSGKSQRPSENVFLIDIGNDSGQLGAVLHHAESLKFPHRVLYFQDDPVVYSWKPQVV